MYLLVLYWRNRVQIISCNVFVKSCTREESTGVKMVIEYSITPSGRNGSYKNVTLFILAESWLRLKRLKKKCRPNGEGVDSELYHHL